MHKKSNVLVSKSLKNEIARRDVVGWVDDAGKMDGTRRLMASGYKAKWSDL